VDKVPKIVSILGTVPIDKVELVPEIADSASDPVFRSILGSPLREIADPFRPPTLRGLRLERGKPKRLVKPPLIAPANTMRNLSLSLAEKKRIFDCRKTNDLWALYLDFRSQFQRPDESDRAVRHLCVEWKSKFEGRSPFSLQRFFKQHPDVAVWATWTEKAIHETQARSSKNKFPRLELLRECIGIMMQHRLQRPTS
jgi:hypothetical protein